MSFSNFIPCIKWRKTILCFIYLVFLLFCFVSQNYHKTSTWLDINADNDDFIDIYNFNEEQNKIKLKEDFHLNIFDFESFKSVKWKENNHSGPCVKTKIEVSTRQFLIGIDYFVIIHDRLIKLKIID